MNKRILIFALLLVIAAAAFGNFSSVLANPNRSPAAQEAVLPDIKFLGEGPGTFTIDNNLLFLVKTYVNGQFLFEAVEPPTYTAVAHERVWSTNFMPAEPIRLFDEWKNFGQVQAGCTMYYVQIEDNVDARRNTFYLNGQVLQVVEQGMVTYGSITPPQSGELTFFAEDSIGMVTTACTGGATIAPSVPAATASFTPTSTSTVEPPTPTFTATATATVTDTPTATATATVTSTLPPGVTPSITPTNTLTPDPTATTRPATDTPEPTATNTARVIVITATTGPSRTPTATSTSGSGVAVQITPTRSPTATLRATNTLVPTPGSIPVTGGGPGPGEVAAMGGALLVGLSLAAGGWFRVMRWWKSHE